MAIKGDGLDAIKAMWGLLAMTAIFVALRAYTRIFVVHSYGTDDNVYNLAFLFLFLYTLFTTVSAYFGFGQNMTEIEETDRVKAILWELIGQTFAVLGTAIAKVSLGLFLLRLVNRFSIKMAIWLAMGILMGASISTTFVLWLQCSPPSYFWDRRIAVGYCYTEATTVYTVLSAICVAVDFLFPIVPWLFIWNLQLPQKERLIVLASMSLEFIAGGFGIQRSLQVSELSSENYLKDTVGLVVWTAAEMAVTLVCIGIPASRSLCKQFRAQLVSGYPSDYKKKAQQVYGLRSIGGSQGQRPHRLEEGVDNNDALIALPPPVNQHHHLHHHHHAGRPIGLGGQYATTSSITGPNRVQCYNKSDEEVLLDSSGRSRDAPSLPTLGAGIRITEEFQVTRT